MRRIPSPLTPPTLRDDLPRYPAIMQICLVTAETVPAPGSTPNLYVATTEQVTTDTLLPRDRETCVVDDLTGGGLDPGYYICRLVGSYVTTTIVSSSITGNSSPQPLTPASMSGIVAGMVLVVGTGSSQEQTSVISVTSTTFTAIILNNHAVSALSSFSVSLDGVDDYVDIGTPTVIADAPVSVTAWIKRSAISNGFNSILASDPGGWAFDISDVNTLLFALSGTSDVVGVGTIADTNWHHVAVTYDGATVNFYIDGALDTSVPYVVVFTDQPKKIGYNTAFAQPFAGNVTDVRVFIRALSGKDVASIAVGDDPDTNDPTGWWRFTEGSGATVADSSGNGNIGTLTNGASWSSDVPVGVIIVAVCPLYAVPSNVGESSITIEASDTSPSYTGIHTLQIDKTQGIVLTQPSAGIAEISLVNADVSQTGVVSTGDQSFGGHKTFADYVTAVYASTSFAYLTAVYPGIGFTTSGGDMVLQFLVNAGITYAGVINHPASPGSSQAGFAAYDDGSGWTYGQYGTLVDGSVISGGIVTTIGSNTFPAVTASADLTGQTNTVSSVCTYTPGADGTYRIGGYITITARVLASVVLTVTYTDETSASRTQTFFAQGSVTSSLTATGSYSFPPLDIRAKSGNAITVVATVTLGGGSITYDVGADIEFLR